MIFGCANYIQLYCIVLYIFRLPSIQSYSQENIVWKRRAACYYLLLFGHQKLSKLAKTLRKWQVGTTVFLLEQIWMHSLLDGGFLDENFDLEGELESLVPQKTQFLCERCSKTYKTQRGLSRHF